jgi:YfiR/HmsC-like
MRVGRRGQLGCRRSPLALSALSALILLGLAFDSPMARSQSVEPAEYQLKAAFLFNFAKFIQWPSSSFANSQSEFGICILGDDPFGKSIDDVLRGKTIGEHPVAVTRAKHLEELTHCQIVFVSSSEKKRMPEILAVLKGTNTLAVGETEGFAASGGVIQFTIEDQRVRFIINVDAAERAGLQISSKLLALARVVSDVPASRKS